MSKQQADQVFGRSPAESLTHRLLRKLGNLIPETVDDVRRAEGDLAEIYSDLPESLKDPDKVFEGSLTVSLPEVHVHPPQNEEVLRGFSAAARDGRGLTSEVTERMERDWAEARRNHEDEDDDNGQGDRGAS